MTVLPVRLFGDPVLRTRADEVTAFDAELHALVDDMLDTMDANRGVGLAAPQVGVARRVFVWDCDGDRGHVVNPVWKPVGEGIEVGDEGCLSVPGVRGETRRHAEVEVEGLDREGESVRFTARGLLAKAVQHETDHLDGILFMSRLEGEGRRAAMREIRESVWFGAPAILAGELVDTGGNRLGELRGVTA